MELLELYRRSISGFLTRVERIGARDWDRPTPCPAWTVRDLVNHVVYEDRWAVPLMAGRTIAEVGDRFDGDLLGDDPVGRTVDAAKQAEAAAAEPGALERTVQLSFGPTPADEYTWQMVAEHLLHGWDLAAATGADRRLDAVVVSACAGWFLDRERLFRDAGAIGPRVAVPSGADEQDKLLAAYGRDPDWSR
ncbi:MAG TPA: TIGR03086 family metal-binding protein [Actinoplanes sp.]|jgi:uncharacterized protein (TIGR03086 family)|nr:TIGR03086 family metal-binding protein [Actinoplanes sp.]